MANPRANTLFHFTPKFDILTDILKTGFWPRFCREEYEWLVRSRFSLRIPMVCFCDIPLSRIQSHTADYGAFGLGMTRAWGKRKGLNPLVYVKEGSALWKEFEKLHLIQGNPAHRNDTLSKAFANLIGFAKPFEGPVNRGSNPTTNKEFYQECEWRHVLDAGDAGAFFTNDDKTKDTQLTDLANNASRKHPLSFDCNDIRYLLVESETYAEQLADFLHTEPALKFSTSECTRLTTRIEVLSSLQEDI
jgi:hypothetical protein